MAIVIRRANSHTKSNMTIAMLLYHYDLNLIVTGFDKTQLPCTKTEIHFIA